MKLNQILLATGAVFALAASAASAQEAESVPVFQFDVERVSLQDESNTVSIYSRLVSEAGDYCGGIVPTASVEYPVCVEAMVTHVVDELEHAPLTRLHQANMSRGQEPWQAVAFNAG